MYERANGCNSRVGLQNVRVPTGLLARTRQFIPRVRYMTPWACAVVGGVETGTVSLIGCNVSARRFGGLCCHVPGRLPLPPTYKNVRDHTRC